MIKSTPDFSIIIPTFNRCSFLGETLDSVMNQTYRNWECMVIDDSSTDYTKELMTFYTAKDKRIHFRERPEHKSKGANACRNFGLKLSTGRFLLWFDDDDLMSGDLLERVREVLERREIDFVIWKHLIFDDISGNTRFVAEVQTTPDKFMRDFLTATINLSTQTVAFKREFLDQHRFNEEINRLQDFDLFFRVFSQQKYSFEVINHVLVFLRYHENTLTKGFFKNDFKSIRSELQVRKSVIAYAQEEKWELNDLKFLLQSYEEAFLRLNLNFSLKYTLKEFKKIKEGLKVKPSFYFWTLKITFYTLIYKWSNRYFRLLLTIRELKYHLKTL